MKKTDLSIITPCYNCENTLEETVDSIYIQNLTIPFEVVLVDDGSSDGTRELIKRLADKHREIKYVFHEQNKGGGAARNTAIENTSSDLILSWDGDDILGDNCLNILYQTFKENENNIDGVSLNIRKYFDDTNKDKVTTVEYDKNSATVEALFSGKDHPITYNFLYTKESFYKAGGYPTHHGFDTQGYGWRWLSKGNKAMVGDGSCYYHRLNQVGKKSYSEREFENGKLSENSYYVLKELLHLFKKEVQDFILGFDIYSNNEPDNYLFYQMMKKFNNDIMVENYKDLLK